MKKEYKTKFVWEPKIESESNVYSPDAFDGASGLIPPDDFVVSRNRDGSVASRYGDYEWNLTAYHSRGEKSNLYFRSWCKGDLKKKQRQIIKEMQWLMFILIWKRHGNTLSVRTLETYANLLRQLAKFAHDNACRIEDVLCDAQMMRGYLEAASKDAYVVLASLLRVLIQFEEEEVGFRVLGGATIATLQALAHEYQSGLKQHAPVPTRIYSYLITHLMRELSDFVAISDSYLRVVEMCATDPLLGSVSGGANPRKYGGESLSENIGNKDRHKVIS